MLLGFWEILIGYPGYSGQKKMNPEPENQIKWLGMDDQQQALFVNLLDVLARILLFVRSPEIIMRLGY
jgi:hypothetical protein